MAFFPDYTPYSFLLVDDDVFVREMLERLLKLCTPRRIVTVDDGGGALRTTAADATGFDCILTDFDMKPINGLQLLAAIRLGVNPNIPRSQPVVMLTGNPAPEVRRAAYALDVNGFMVKPVRPETLYPIIERVLKSPTAVKPTGDYRAVKLPTSSGVPV